MSDMHGETTVVPYITSPLPQGPWIVFAPHADDETFGMGGSLLLAREQGIETHVVIVTDGALGGEGDRATLIAARAEEGRRACKALGVSQLHFMEEPDRGLRVTEQTKDKVKALIKTSNAASVFFPTPLEYHPDHRVTADLVWTSIAEMPEYKGQLYSYEITTQAPINLLIDTTDVAAEKYSVVDLYATQLTQSKYLALTQAMDTARTFTLPLDRQAAEGFFHFSDRSTSLEALVLDSVRNYFAKL
ncbi:MAG: PIG-L deacetylase family protein [Pseudohongiellaceae bacterium]